MGKVFAYVTPDGVEHKINYTELNLDDSVVSGTKGWSSGKIKDELDKKATVVQLNTKADSSTVSDLIVRVGNNEKAITALQTLTNGDHSTLNSHVNNKNNPHGVTKAQLSLDKVENTALSSWAGTSNLTTCSKGTFGDACTKAVSSEGNLDVSVQKTTVPNYEGLYNAIMLNNQLSIDKSYSAVRVYNGTKFALANISFALVGDELTITTSEKTFTS